VAVPRLELVQQRRGAGRVGDQVGVSQHRAWRGRRGAGSRGDVGEGCLELLPDPCGARGWGSRPLRGREALQESSGRSRVMVQAGPTLPTPHQQSGRTTAAKSVSAGGGGGRRRGARRGAAGRGEGGPPAAAHPWACRWFRWCSRWWPGHWAAAARGHVGGGGPGTQPASEGNNETMRATARGQSGAPFALAAAGALACWGAFAEARTYAGGRGDGKPAHPEAPGRPQTLRRDAGGGRRRSRPAPAQS
jgi:hypothetical protein